MSQQYLSLLSINIILTSISFYSSSFLPRPTSSPLSSFSLSSLLFSCFSLQNRLAGLVVKVSASGAEDPELSHASDSKIGTPVATMPGAWHCRVSAGTGRPGVSILFLCEVESLICNFYLGVAARRIVCAHPSLRHTSMLLGR